MELYHMVGVQGPGAGLAPPQLNKDFLLPPARKCFHCGSTGPGVIITPSNILMIRLVTNQAIQVIPYKYRLDTVLCTV